MPSPGIPPASSPRPLLPAAAQSPSPIRLPRRHPYPSTHPYQLIRQHRAPRPQQHAARRSRPVHTHAHLQVHIPSPSPQAIAALPSSLFVNTSLFDDTSLSTYPSTQRPVRNRIRRPAMSGSSTLSKSAFKSTFPAKSAGHPLPLPAPTPMPMPIASAHCPRARRHVLPATRTVTPTAADAICQCIPPATPPQLPPRQSPGIPAPRHPPPC